MLLRSLLLISLFGTLFLISCNNATPTKPTPSQDPEPEPQGTLWLSDDAETSLVGVLETKTGQRVQYYGAKAQDGTPLNVNFLRLDEGDSSLNITLDEQGLPTEIFTDQGDVIKYEWDLEDNMLHVQLIAAESQDELNFSIDLFGEGFGIPDQPDVISDPRNIRDNIDIEVIGIPIKGEGIPDDQFRAESSTSDLIIDISLCGFPLPSSVNANVIVNNNEDWIFSKAKRVGGNRYKAPIPLFDPTEGELFGDVCETTQSVLSSLCTANSLNNERATKYGCTALATAVFLLAKSPAVFSGALIACERSFKALDLYCNTLNASSIPGVKSLDVIICENISDLLKDDPIREVEISVFVPEFGVSAHNSRKFSFPAKGPFGSVSIDIPSTFRFSSLNITPRDPAPGQRYRVATSVICADPNELITISVRGTDGYFNQKTYRPSGVEEQIVLSVPGAAANVRDEIIVSYKNTRKQASIIF